MKFNGLFGWLKNRRSVSTVENILTEKEFKKHINTLFGNLFPPTNPDVPLTVKLPAIPLDIDFAGAGYDW